MPNCDFLAADNDFRTVFEHVLECGDFEVYEAYSPYGNELAKFDCWASLLERYPSLGTCRGTEPSCMLQLLVPQAGSVITERIALDPRACSGHTFRYRASGWGLIQLQLGGIGPKGLVLSHTNHNSLARATAWEPTYREVLGPVSAWDWPHIASASRKLNRFIAAAAVTKVGSWPVLPWAASYQGRQ
jgi:hypothetical protein